MSLIVNKETEDIIYLRMAFALARQGMANNQGGPFGAVVVRHDQVIGKGCNQVTSSCDPTAHAEIVAIREACKHLEDYQLLDCTIYTSCEPCPMCLGAIYWARPDRVVFGGTREDAALAGFDDAMIYKELPLSATERRLPMQNLLREEAQILFQEWLDKLDKIPY